MLIVSPISGLEAIWLENTIVIWRNTPSLLGSVHVTSRHVNHEIISQFFSELERSKQKCYTAGHYIIRNLYAFSPG